MAPEQTLAGALERMGRHKVPGGPVVEKSATGRPGKLVGIFTNRDVRFAEQRSQPVAELMTSNNLATVKPGVSQEDACRLLHQRRIEKLLVVDEDYRCVGLITVKDIEKAVNYPAATKDSSGRLRVAAASTVGDAGFERTMALVDAECDLVVIDTAHGHSKMVSEMVARIKKDRKSTRLLAGHVPTADPAKQLTSEKRALWNEWYRPGKTWG